MFLNIYTVDLAQKFNLNTSRYDFSIPSGRESVYRVYNKKNRGQSWRSGPQKIEKNKNDICQFLS